MPRSEGGTMYAGELQTHLPDLCVVQNFRTHHCGPFPDPLGETWNSYPFQPLIQVKIILWNATITYSPRPFDFSWPKIQVDMAILDFSKAFDTVPYDHLLGKMEFCGIQGPLLKWTASFFKTSLGWGAVFLLKLEYYSCENLLNLISSLCDNFTWQKSMIIVRFCVLVKLR